MSTICHDIISKLGKVPFAEGSEPCFPLSERSVSLVPQSAWHAAHEVRIAMSKISVRSLVLAILLTAICSERAFSAPQVTFSAIKIAWQERNDLVKQGQFVWTETRVEKAGWKNGGQAFDGKMLPPTDLKYTRECRLLLDGNKWAYKYSPPPDQTESLKTILLEEYRESFNGDVFKKLSAPTGNLPHHQGEALHGSQKLQNLYMMPFIWAFRLPNKLLEYQIPAEMEVTNQEGVVEGHRCLILQDGDAIDGKNVLWVDPVEGYLIRKYIFIQEDTAIVQVDISYSSTIAAEGKWVPSQWEIILRRHNKALQVAVLGKVRERVINQSIDSREFNIDFPDGTVVYQDKDPGQYIQLAPNSIRPFTNDDAIKMDYEELLANNHPPNRRRFVLYGGLAVIALAISVFFLRKFRRSRTT
jgi:hypothetical protein